MMDRRGVSMLHRLLGLVSLLPLAGWILSSFVLHGVGMFLPDTGLRGEYRLESTHAANVDLESDLLLTPDSVLSLVERDGLVRVYWLRLDALGDLPVWIVKPGPFDVEQVYDARTGVRLDPLDGDMLRTVADHELIGTAAASMEPGREFNRYYRADDLETVTFGMEGEQPSEITLLTASGRTLSRMDPLAGAFNAAYRSLHIWQWGTPMWFFTALLFMAAGIALAAVVLGYILWWDRRDRRKRWTSHVRTERRLHAKLAPAAGLILATQMLVGAYLWFNLGIIEPRFRGQGSFRLDWGGGIEVSESLATPSEVESTVRGAGLPEGRDVQRYEWRAIGDDRFWVAYGERDADGVLVDASRRTVVEELTEAQARTAGAMVVLGEAVGAGVGDEEYWMDFNRFVPTWRFRFSDPDESDIHVSRTTGEVVQRRPAIWRAFGPFLVYHTFGFTGNKWLDTLLLGIMQAILIAMMISGWRLSRRAEPSS